MAECKVKIEGANTITRIMLIENYKVVYQEEKEPMVGKRTGVREVIPICNFVGRINCMIDLNRWLWNQSQESRLGDLQTSSLWSIQKILTIKNTVQNSNKNLM